MSRLYVIPLLVAALGSGSGCAPRRSVAHGEPFTIVVLPDTQCYCDTRLQQSAKRWKSGDLREYFFTQTRWIRDSADELNIVFVVHEGDITQTDYDEEWEIAQTAMETLDGVVPYCMCLGNHDMGYEKTDASEDSYNTATNRSTLFNRYFPRKKYETTPEFGGTHEPTTHDNSFYTFEQSGMSFLILSLEFKPRDEVLAWAGEVLSRHPEHRAIILTHSYLNNKNERVASDGYKISGNNGELMWQKLVSKHASIFMVLCGHVLGEGRLTSTGDHGNSVHQLLCDYQGMDKGGESWLRYMTFHPRQDKIEVYTYNPALKEFRTQATSRFTLSHPMLGSTGFTAEAEPPES